MTKIAFISCLTLLLFAFVACANLAYQNSQAEPSVGAHGTVLLANNLPVPHATVDLHEVIVEVSGIFHGAPSNIYTRPLQKKGPDYAPRRPMIALTFDDGPSRYTTGILDVLEEHGAHATFFVLGYRVAAWEETVLRAVALGSEVAGHSWNHANFLTLSNDAMRSQIRDTSAAIESVTGATPPSFIRVPYGSISPAIRSVTRELGYHMVNWSIDPADWRVRDADIIYNHIMERAVDGGIVLLHDIRPSTVEAVERVVPSLIALGFDLVTVSALLEHFFDDISPGALYTGIR